MSDWSEQEKKALIDKLVKDTALGRDGDIHKTLQDILNVLKKGQIDYKEMASEIAKASSKVTKDAFVDALGSSGGGSSRPKKNPLMDDDISKSAALQNLKNGFNSLGKMAGMAVTPLKGLTQQLLSAKGGLMNFAASMAVGMTAGEVVKDTLRSYRKFADVGQNFSGSMMNMHIAAADAAMSLEEYTSIMTNANTAMVNARLGGAYAGMQKQLRNNMMQFGMFGMTTEEVNEQFTEYLSTAQVFGQLEGRSSQQLVESFQSLVAETTAYSSVTGRSRRAMLKDINEASKNVIATSRMLMLPKEQAVQAQASFKKVVGTFSAFGDESSKFFGQALGDAMSQGGLQVSKFGQELTEAGLGNMIPAFNKLGQSVLDGSASEDEAAASVEQFMKSIDANKQVLHAQATAGNQAAIQALKMADEFRSAGDIRDVMRKRKKAEEDAERMKPLTQAISNLEHIFSSISGAFRKGFLTAIRPVFDIFTKFATDDNLKEVTAYMEDLGKGMGEFLSSVLTEQNLKLMKQHFMDFLEGVKKTGVYFKDVILPLLKNVIGPALGMAATFLLKTAGAIIDGLTWVHAKIDKVLDDWLGIDNKDVRAPLAIIGTAIAAGITLLFAKFIKDKISNGLSNMWARWTGKDTGKIIQAPGAKIFAGGGHGGGKGGGFDLPDLDGPGGESHPKGKGKGARLKKWGGRLGAAAAIAGTGLGLYGMATGNDTATEAGEYAALGGGALSIVSSLFGDKGGEAIAKETAKEAGTKTAEKAAGKMVGKEAAKIGAKGLGKALVKKIPLLGLGAGALFAAQRAWDGDWTGAGMELASGAASTIPGVGTAASVAIDAALAAKDMGAFDSIGGNSEKKPEESPVLKMDMPPPLTETKKVDEDRHKEQMDMNKSLEELMQKHLAVLNEIARGIGNMNRGIRDLPDSMA